MGAPIDDATCQDRCLRSSMTDQVSEHPRERRGGRRAWETCGRRDRCAPNGQTVHPQDASTRGRTGGAPLAAMHKQLTLSICKRRDAVRLALNEPARPAGAAFGGLSASAASWAAPRQIMPFAPPGLWARCRRMRVVLALHSCGRTAVPKSLQFRLACLQNAFAAHAALGCSSVQTTTRSR